MDYETNSPHQDLRECIEKSMENMYTNVWVERVKEPNCFMFGFIRCNRYSVTQPMCMKRKMFFSYVTQASV